MKQFSSQSFSGKKRKITYDTPDQFDDEQSSGCLEMAVFAIVIVFLFWLFAGCNNAQHMQKVYPKGYYMHGKYLSNHSKPRNDTTR